MELVGELTFHSYTKCPCLTGSLLNTSTCLDFVTTCIATQAQFGENYL